MTRMTQDIGTSSPGSVTQLLSRVRSGDSEAGNQLMDCVYDQLKRLASQVSDAGGTPTLGPTAIVHEYFLRLSKANALADVQDRKHLFALACKIMNQVLVDHARSKQTKKRGGDHRRLVLDVLLEFFHTRQWDILELSEALELLEAEYPRKAKVVYLKFFGGMTTEEIANMLGISKTTVESDWRFARAFLKMKMDPPSK